MITQKRRTPDSIGDLDVTIAVKHRSSMIWTISIMEFTQSSDIILAFLAFAILVGGLWMLFQGTSKIDR
jgi:hypothetical protein